MKLKNLLPERQFGAALTHTLVLACVVALAACGGSEGGATTSTSTEGDATSGAEATDGTNSGAPVEEPSRARPAPLDVPYVAALVAGDRASISRSQGIRRVVFRSGVEGDPGVNDEGNIETAEHLCGAELDAWLATLSSDWGDRMSDEFSAPTCQHNQCRFPSTGHSDVSTTLSYSIIDGVWVLHSVVLIEGPPVGEEFMARGQAFADRSIAAMAGDSCTP